MVFIRYYKFLNVTLLLFFINILDNLLNILLNRTWFFVIKYYNNRKT